MRVRVGLFAMLLVALVPAAGFAQATISGVVKDASGAVLPGVTVEAASPALIEKVRSVVTDGAGLYRIVDLRPGAYTVTFSLPGFNTVKRDGIELTGSFTATVNVDLRVGAVEETITVTGEAPIVDVQGTTKQTVMTKSVIDAVPTSRIASTLGVLVPGMIASSSSTTQDVGGANGDAMTTLSIHGSRAADMRVTQNGVSTATVQAGGANGMSSTNMGAAQEVTIDTGSVSAELAQGGPRINLIPRDGGNTFAGSFFGSFANESLQGSNYTDRLKGLGLTSPDAIEFNTDLNPGFGGPIKRDKAWFYATARYLVANNYVGGMFANANAGNPNAWTYVADTSQPSINKNSWKDGQARVTWQVTAKNKFAATYDQQDRCSCPFFISATRSPEAANYRRSPQQRLVQAEWTSPVTNRLLFEAVALHHTERWGNHEPQIDGAVPGMIGVLEQSNGLTYRGGGQGGSGGAAGTYNDTWVPNFVYRAAASYITGSHAMKAGINDVIANSRIRIYNPQPTLYRFNNGVPNQITLFATPYETEQNQDHDLGLFIQDRWTISRLTLTGGLRFDYYASSFPDQTLESGILVPGRSVTLPGSDNLNWKDITPRTGASFDLFGTGKTAVKASLNKYLGAQGLNGLGTAPNPINTLVLSTTRSWADANRDFIPDCDLTATGQSGECGAMANPNFGRQVPAASFDPELLTGWGHRFSNWEFSTAVQHALTPKLSIDVAYFRRWYNNFQVTDNLALSAADFDRFSIVAPVDNRLPSGGGYTVAGLYNVKPERFSVPTENFNTLSKNYGTQTEHWNGVDVNLSARLDGGVALSGGISTGKTVTDSCEIRAAIPESTVVNPYCRVESPFLTQVKLLGVYIVPVAKIQIAGTFQSIAGPEILANYVATNAAVQPSLGRPLSGGVANVTVNLVNPSSMYGERLNQLDLRFGRPFQLGRARTTVNVDLYNALNVDTVLSVNNNYASWQRPTLNLQARFVKFGVQVDF